MTVAQDAIGATLSDNNTGATSISGTPITVGTGSNRALIVEVAFLSAQASVTVTWDVGGTNQALTLIGTATVPATNMNTRLYGLVNPVSGTKTLTISYSVTDSVLSCVTSYTGVNQTGGTTSFPNFTTATGNSTTNSITITSATGDMAVATHVNGSAGYLSTNGTNIYILSGTNISGAANQAAGAATVNLTALINFGVSGPWASAGVDIAQPSTSVPTGGGSNLASGATFFSLLPYQGLIEPVNFSAAALTWNAWAQWPDFATKPRPPLNFQPWSFIEPAPQVWYPPNIYPDILLPLRFGAQNQQFLAASPTKIGVTFDAQSANDLTGHLVTSFTDNTQMTVGTGPNRALVALIAWGNASGGNELPKNINLTWGGQTLQLISNTAVQQNGIAATSIYGLLNPVSGTQTFAGSWTGASDFVVSLVSFTNVDQTSFSTSFINATNTIGSGVNPATINVNSVPLDYTVGVFANAGLGMGPVTNGTQVFIDTSLPNVSGTGIRFGGASPSVTLGVAVNPASNWVAAGVDIVFAGTAPPLFWNQWTQWPDTAPAAKRVAQNQDWGYGTFVTPFAVPTYTQWTQWPDFATRAKPAVDFTPWTFVPPPAQVWYPPEKWPDTAPAARRVAQNQDWSYGTFITPTFTVTWVPWTTWPDFAPRARSAADFVPWVFLEPAPQVWYPPNVVPDIVPTRAKPVADFIPWSFVAPTLTTPWSIWTPWPDIVPVRAKPAADFIPWAFVPPPAQVWFPPIPWPDRIYAKWQKIDTQPSAFVAIVVTANTLQAGYVQWPDFAKAKAFPLNYDPLAFVQTVRTPVNGFVQWPDFARGKAVPLNFDPLTLVQTVRTPWNTLSTWPDFAPIRGKAGLHAALQQFSARFPGTITGTTVNMIMNAFETNTDGATFAIYVIQSQPAVNAAISIKEIGTLGGSITP